MSRNRDLAKLPFETLGGTAGQLLSKATATDYDFQWIDNFTSDVEHDVKAGEAVSKGDAVYISTADGTNMIVTKADNTAEGTSSKTIGLMKDTLALNGIGRVITEGLLSGTGSAPLNTSTATIGDPVWLGGSGTLIFGLANKPYAPKHLVFLGVVTRVHSVNGEIFVKVQNGFELKEIHDVQARTPSLKDTLYYDTADSQWKTASISTILDYTPVTSARTISTTAPLSGGGDLSANRTLSISQATTSTDGYLTSTDWNTFNSKEPALTKGNLTESTSSVLTITGGSNAIIGSGLTIQVKQATSLVSGYLSSTDWSTFNGKQAALSGSGIVKSTGGTISYLTDNSTNWDSAYTNRITSLTTTGDSGPADLTANILNIPEYTLDGLGGQAKSVNLTSLSGLTYSSASFVKMTAAGTFSLDTTVYYPVTNPAGFTSNTGTVTSVAALTIGTTGTDITSSVANGTTTPVITLNIPDASATARGVITMGAQTFAGAKTFATAPILTSLTASQILALDGSGNVQSLAVATYPSLTELAYVKGVTSAIQTQLNGKQSTLTFSTGITNTSGTVKANLSTGVSGGQSVIGGNASGNNLTLSSTSDATKGKILFGTSAYDEVNNRLGLGTASPSYAAHFVLPTLNTGETAFYLSAAIAAASSGVRTMVQWDLTTAGSNTSSIYGFNVNLLSGYTGTSATQAGRFVNSTAGTGTNIFSGVVNQGISGISNASTTGVNVGMGGTASGGSTNIGNRSIADSNVANSTNIGMFGLANNTGTGTVYEIGGYFGLNTATPTFGASAALMCDNFTKSVDIFVARDNGTKKWSIADGGNTVWADGVNMVFGAGGAGTQIGGSGNKLALYGATPIAQPTTGGTAATFAAVAGGSAVDTNDTFDGYTIGQVVKALRNLGILA